MKSLLPNPIEFKSKKCIWHFTLVLPSNTQKKGSKMAIFPVVAQLTIFWDLRFRHLVLQTPKKAVFLTGYNRTLFTL